MKKVSFELVLVEREEIEIGAGICITILEAKKGRCKLGIEAPGEVKIQRGEKK